jgi:hypothetical protein
MTTFRGRINLADVTGDYPPLICNGVAYLGWPTLIVGKTGAAKTLISRWLLREEMRGGRVVGHLDQEMGQNVTKVYYEELGLTPEELAEVVYYDWPNPKLTEAEDLLNALLSEPVLLNDAGDEIHVGVDVLLWDKLPDFLRAAGLAENDNDHVNEWAATFLERIQGRITSLIIDATGWAGEHSRGGSEKDFKMALTWLVEVIDEPRRDHVGLVRWTCTKDRFGAVGRGTKVEFSVGGDGDGNLICSVVGITPGDTVLTPDDRAKRELEREGAWKATAIAAAKKHAPDEANAVARAVLEGLMGSGRSTYKRDGIAAAIADINPRNERLGAKTKPGGNGILVWWKPAGGDSSGLSGSRPDEQDKVGREGLVPRPLPTGTGQVDKSSDGTSLPEEGV